MKQNLLRSLTLLVCALAALGFAGCAEGPTIPTGNIDSPETAGVPAVLLDDDLADVIAVDLVRIGHNANGLLTASANIRNRTDHDVAIQAQARFFDRNGMVLYEEPGNQTAWTSLVLTANGTQFYRANALSRAADHVTVRIRFLRRYR